MKHLKLFEEHISDKEEDDSTRDELIELGLADPDPYYERVESQLAEAGIEIIAEFNLNDEAKKPRPDFSEMIFILELQYNNMEFDLEWENDYDGYPAKKYKGNIESQWRLAWSHDFEAIDNGLSLAEVIEIIKTSTPKPEDTDFEVDADLTGLPKDAQKKLMAVRNRMKDLGLGQNENL